MCRGDHPRCAWIPQSNRATAAPTVSGQFSLSNASQPSPMFSPHFRPGDTLHTAGGLKGLDTMTQKLAVRDENEELPVGGEESWVKN